MRGALAENFRAYGQHAALLMKFLYRHSHAVRYLIAQRQEYLLTDDLRGDNALGLIRYHIIGEEMRSLLRKFRYFIYDYFGIFAVFRADRNDGGKIIDLREAKYRIAYLARVALVRLIHDEQCRNMHDREFLHQLTLGRSYFVPRLYEKQNNIHLACGFARLFHHIVAELCPRLMNTGRIDENVLCFALCQYTRDLCARGLRFARNDRYLLAEERIEQSAFAYVRTAYDRRKKIFCLHIYFCPSGIAVFLKSPAAARIFSHVSFIYFSSSSLISWS